MQLRGESSCEFINSSYLGTNYGLSGPKRKAGIMLQIYMELLRFYPGKEYQSLVFLCRLEGDGSKGELALHFCHLLYASSSTPCGLWWQWGDVSCTSVKPSISLQLHPCCLASYPPFVFSRWTVHMLHRNDTIVAHWIFCFSHPFVFRAATYSTEIFALKSLMWKWFMCHRRKSWTLVCRKELLWCQRC